MNSTKKTARIAGVLYLVNGVTGFFGIIYVPSRLIVSGNAAATANNILASESLFRVGIVSELICAAEFVFLLWAGAPIIRLTDYHSCTSPTARAASVGT